MALSTIGTAAIADDAITSAKVDSTTTAFTVADLVVTNGISAGTDIVGNISGRILLDASASGTDVGDEFLLDGTDGSATNAGSKIVFEEGTDDPNIVLTSNVNAGTFGTGGSVTLTDQFQFPTNPNSRPLYESGTYTPQLFDAASGGNTDGAGTAIGIWRRIGDIVFVSISMVNITKSGLTAGNVGHITVPFRSLNNNANYATSVPMTSVLGGTGSDSVPPFAILYPNRDRFFLARVVDGANFHEFTIADYGSGVDVSFSLSYVADITNLQENA
jgi:hypothetical protein